jgi:3(or 17)beta-hydroxysteroid dehydrogenase
MGRMDGRVALITGGASGLGAEDAKVLAREGARVVITDVQDELGAQIAAEIPGSLYLHQDVRSEARWHEVVAETIKTFGRLDTLVNNAGLVTFGDVEALSYADFKRQIDVMLDGTFLGCQAAIPHMSREGWGSIINIGSIGAIKGLSAIPAYAGAKGGIIAMTRSIAVHCKEQGNKIRVNSIAPGSIVTPMTAQALAQLSSDSAGISALENNGMGLPRDIANTVLFLASDDGSYLNGANIVVDNCESVG